jgi:hypothetical protein
VASDETGVRIEGCTGHHWVFRCRDAVVLPTLAAAGFLLALPHRGGWLPW